MFYVVETDAPCKRCGGAHGYATSMCTLIVFADRATARITAKTLEGSVIREISDLPPDISYNLDMRKGGRPDPRFAEKRYNLSGS